MSSSRIISLLGFNWGLVGPTAVASVVGIAPVAAVAMVVRQDFPTWSRGSTAIRYTETGGLVRRLLVLVEKVEVVVKAVEVGDAGGGGGGDGGSGVGGSGGR